MRVEARRSWVATSSATDGTDSWIDQGTRSEVEAALFGASTSTAGQHPDIEAELFGTEGQAPKRDVVGSPSFEPVPGQSLDGDAGQAIRAAISAADDRLAIGGNLFLRLEYRALSEGNPESFSLVSPSTLDLFLDSRPVDRVRAYVRTRLFHDGTLVEGGGVSALDLLNPAADPQDVLGLLGGQQDRTSLLLDQLWLKFDIERRVFITAGKQRVRWGTGRVWNPSDFLNAQRFDPLALFDQRLGVGLVKFHLPFEDQGANIYAIVNFDGANTLERLGAALRAEVAFGQSEVALSGSWRQGEALRLGADASTGLGDFELRTEAAFLYDVRAPFFEGRWSASEPLDFSDLRVRYREDEIIPQLVVGLDWTVDYGDGDQAILGVEYFWNDAGYDDASLYPVLLLAPNLDTLEAAGLVELGLREPSPVLFQPLYLGRHYLSAFALFPAPFDWEDHTFVLTGIGNLSDQSWIARLDHTLRLFRFLSLRTYLNLHLGRKGEFRFGLQLGTVPGIFDEGFAVVPPLFEFGIALNATF